MTASLSAGFLIIGSGIAGLRAALALAGRGRVLVLTKSDPGAGSTGYAQGGIAAAVGPDDSPAQHAADTRAAAAGLANPAAVEVLVREGPAFVRDLVDRGAAFDRRPDGTLDLAREGAHSVRRVLHARDATGREIARVLAAGIADHPSVVVHDHATVIQLLVEHGRVTGARFLDETDRVREARADVTLLATGGAGQMFRDTTNPAVACGDGIALAYLAGARVTDLEFVQFHPTALAVGGAGSLLSEALRGEGARLVNAAGEAFMPRYDPAGDLAPRDRVSRAILTESARTGAPIYLSLRHLDAGAVRRRFPAIVALCREAGLDLATDRLPVTPAAHYMMGGVVTDLDGRTSLPGLFAAGEVACTGVHGANRLASNSLLEGLVFGGRAGVAMADADRPWPVETTAGRPLPPPGHESATLPIDETGLRALSSAGAGVFRDRRGLERMLDRLDPAWRVVEQAVEHGAGMDAATWRLMSLITVARLVARAALRRDESRGAHARTDFPDRDDLHWVRHMADVR